MSHLSLGPKTVKRHANRETAEAIAGNMNLLTNNRITVVCEPPAESDSNRGVGDWCVNADSSVSDTFDSHRMSRCSDMALILALADALREIDPNHPLVQDWFMQPENRGKLARYDGKGPGY